MWNPGDDLLLDTSAVIESFRKNPNVALTLRNSSRLFLPVIVYGELLLGAEKSNASSRKAAEIALFTRVSTMLDIDWHTAQHYAKLRAALERQGTPIPENDIWIAALSVQHALHLYTADAHFQQVYGLRLHSVIK